MRTEESIGTRVSNMSSAKSCGNSKPELRKIFGLVRTVVPKPRGKWLERVTGAKPRTAEYWLQGKHQPRGNDAIRIVRALRAKLAEHQRTLEQFELELQ